jgi:protein involved in polysaccharide export with SLBB domain
LIDLTGVTHMNRKQHANPKKRFSAIARQILLVLVSVAGMSTFLASSGIAQSPQSPQSTQDPLDPDSTQNTSQPLTSLSLSGNDTGQNSTIDDTSAAGVAFGGSLDSNSSDNVDDPRSGAMLSNLNGTGTALPADQIIQILEQNPDLLAEVKDQVAERLQQQGTQVQASDITDEMLYTQIQTNATVRAQITSYLQAQGYAPQGGLQSVGGNFPQGDSSSMRTGSSSPRGMNADEASATAGAPLDEGGERQRTNPEVTGMNSGATGTNREGTPERQQRQQTNAATDSPKVLRQPAPYRLRSMHDLYTQIPEQTAPLKRFGSEVFVTRDMSSMTKGMSSSDTPLDVPLGPDYVVGPGDTLTINMWGGMTQTFTRIINRDGQIMLPDAGSLQVAGLVLERAESLIEGALEHQYRNVHAAVTVSKLRSVRVYVVGDVQRPGGYDISSLSTPLSALYAAGGPTSVGSLRIVRHYRGSELIEEVDLYDFLIHGVQKGSAHFLSGDTLQVPPAGPQVAVSGAVKRPAIYELKPGGSALGAVIEDAGSLTAAASLSHITIERIDANGHRETVTIKTGSGQDPKADRAAVDTFAVKDGDRIHISPILPYSERAIYLAGHVARPGRISYNDGMQLSDVLRSYQDMLPEPAEHGEVIRLVPPDLHAETIGFNVPDVLIGNANLPLQPFDTVRIFGRYEVDSPTVKISGEVLRSGTYPMSKGMTAAQLVRMAGGFKRDALVDSADLTSYDIEGGNKVNGKLSVVRIGAAVAGTDPSADVPLQPGDVLTIHQITGWNDIGQSITIQGQVKFPGSYGFKEGELLSSVLRRVGGMRDTAYPEGAVLTREQVRQAEEKSQQELIQQIETNSAAARLGPAVGSGDSGTLALIKSQQAQAIAQLKSHPPTGRMVIHISADIDSWANTPADIEIRRGDVLTIPKRPGFVLVTGQVYNQTALTFSPNHKASWYLSQSGGTNPTANKRDAFIIRVNGTVIGRHSGPSVMSTKLGPGDVVVVPQKIIGTSLFWLNLLRTAQLASSVAITGGIAAGGL